MKQRARRRHSTTGVPPTTSTTEPVAPQGRRVWLVAFLGATVAFITAYGLWTIFSDGRPQEPIAHQQPSSTPEPEEAPDPGEEHGHKPSKRPEQKSEPGSFLDEFNDRDNPSENEGAVLSNEALEKQFQSLAEINERIERLKALAAKTGAFDDQQEFARGILLRDQLLEQFNRKAAALEKAITRSRRARPEDAVPRWLTAELLMMIGAEPEEIFPSLSYAIKSGLHRPGLLSKLARAQLRANQLEEAMRTAAKSLDQGGLDLFSWQVFTEAAIANNQFDSVITRLDQTFRAGMPEWARTMRRDAADLQVLWQAEQKLRQQEARADDLPRVKLVIEHRRFARDAAGNPLTTIESTGRAEVVLELFENEAPLTVANFLDLVGRKYYDGTSFHQAVPTAMVAGGDPNTKNLDPSDDGTGGPGYVIPDEFTSAKARNHFRGSMSMVNKGPGTTGSQFFLCLAPGPPMNGHFTVFGHILQGQDAVDRITQGRTTRLIGQYGKIIPGDLLVSAEILRKRNHEYRVIKLPQ